jgi:tetratricopeptide (TPR) repeat protein
MTKKKRAFIRKNFGKLSVDEICRKTGLDKDEVLRVSRNVNKTEDFSSQHDSPFSFRLFKIYVLPLLAISLMSFVVYSNTLYGKFIYDDLEIINIKAIEINHLSQIIDIIFPDSSQDISRRIGIVSFALNYYFGGLKPFGYHLVNIIIHSLTGFVLFLLIYRTLQQNSSDKSCPTPAYIVAFSGALLWLVHPVQTQAVAYITQRFASMCSLFFLLSLLLYIEGRLSQGNKKIVLFSLSLVSAFLALGTKETAATLPLIILLYELFFFKNLSLRPTGKTLVIIVLMITFFLSISAALLRSEPIDILKQHYINRGYTPLERLMTEARVLVYYLSLLIFPHPGRLRLIYDFTVSQSLFTPLTTLASVVVLGALFIFALVRARKNKFLSFSILWFFINLSIESTVIPLDLVYEHRLYLPSMAPVALFAGFIVSKGTQKWKELSYFGLVIIILIFSYWSYERNKVWQDAVALWEDNAEKSPNHAMVHGNLGRAYMGAGQFDKALIETEKSLQLNPQLTGAYYNLATIYMDYFRDYEKAEKYLKEALKRNRRDSTALFNMGVLYDRQRNFTKSSQIFREYLKKNPDDPIGYYNLATSYYNMRNYDKALDILKKAVNKWPYRSHFHYLRGVCFFYKNDFESAEKAFLKTLSLDENNHKAKRYLIKIKEMSVPEE